MRSIKILFRSFQVYLILATGEIEACPSLYIVVVTDILGAIVVVDLGGLDDVRTSGDQS